MEIFQDSKVIFNNVINHHDIILDDSFESLKNIYVNHIYNQNAIYLENIDQTEYIPYFTIFSEYYHTFKKTINFIYYILILYYINIDVLFGLVRFFIIKLKKFNLIQQNEIEQYKSLVTETKLDKPLLLNFLYNIISISKTHFLFFILIMQYYL